MRLGILLNWRQAVLRTLLVMIILTPDSSQCKAGLWIEQGRYPHTSYQIVQVKVPKPKWLVRLEMLLNRCRNGRQVFVGMLCKFLAFSLLIWLNIFGWLIAKTMIIQEQPMRRGFSWSCPHPDGILEVEMIALLRPTASAEICAIEVAQFSNRPQLSRESSVDSIIVASSNHNVVMIDRSGR